MDKRAFKGKFLKRWNETQDSEKLFDLVFEMMRSFFEGGGMPPDPNERTATNRVLVAYLDAYFLRYKTKLKATPIMIRHCKTLSSMFGGEIAVGVVEEYLRSSDKFYMMKRHALEYCIKDGGMLAAQLAQREAGRRLATKADAHVTEVAEANAQVIADYLAEKEEQGNLL